MNNIPLDFELHIGQRLTHGYPVHIRLSGGEDFNGTLAPDVATWTSTGDKDNDGRRLFDMLFTNSNLRCAWERACGQATQRRIRLWIDADAPELHALPWELLHDGKRWLAATGATPFSRYLPSDVPWGGPITARPIRILAAVANPDDLARYNLAALDVAQEQALLEEVCAPSLSTPIPVALDFLDPPVTLERLEQKLQEGEGYHVLHIVSHGTFSQRRNQAALYLQDSEGHTQIVPDDDLVAMLTRQAVRPHLVFLAACQSAQPSSATNRAATAAAFAGLGPKLIVTAGIPAVVAVQRQVAIMTTRKLTAAFYEHLLRHGAVDRALNAARSLLFTAHAPDAAVPVLFMRLEDGRLWAPPTTHLLSIDTLREAASDCGALLRQHKHTFANTGEHLPRKVVKEIVAWAQDPPEGQHVAVLLDQAGMGKTVVMRDVLCALESLGMMVIAIKADLQLSELIQYKDIQNQLQLPDSVENVVKQLVATAPVVVLLDQIDTLSLSLSRDQKTLNIAIDLLARLRVIPGVRILFSCRKFDYDSDPKLNSIEVEKRFSISRLSDTEIMTVLQKLDVHFDTLTSETQQLLRTPLHLDLFVRVLESQPEIKDNVYSINSLQALYHHLWRNVILKYGPDIPTESEREEVLRVLTDYMNRNRATTVPPSVIRHLQPAVRWLASAGILIQDINQWSFLHQTFFDYCYARNFVERGLCLSETILKSDQGLFARSQLHQVVAYLREVQPDTYLCELNALLTAPDLRFHLHDLLLRWFGSLSNPTDGEWTIAYRKLFDPLQRPKLLQVIRGNPAWFARLNGEPIQALLAKDDQIVDQQIIPYLDSLTDVVQLDVIRIIRPYLGRSEQWNKRLSRLLFHIRIWKTAEAVELLEQLVEQMPTLDLKHFFELPEIVQAYPRSGCRIIRLIFDRVLEDYKRKQEAETENPFVFISHELESLREGSITSAMEIASQVKPDYFVQMMLPWVAKLLNLTCLTRKSDIYYDFDNFSRHWHSDTYIVRLTFVKSFIAALTSIAQTKPDEFRRIATHLASLPGQTPQLFIGRVYQRLPRLYAEDALHFLLADQCRLNLGDSQQFESRQLIRAIVPHLSTSQRAELENAIFETFTGIWKPRDLDDLHLRGLRQLYLLQAIPVKLLSEKGKHILGELERKFPGQRASNIPRMAVAGVIGSPIPSEIARKMSDRDWLRALRKYQGGVEHKDFFKGGADQLANVLTELVKETPERFYRLLACVSDTIDVHYVRAFLNGLAESNAPIAWLFDIVRRFASQMGSDLKRSIAWALRKRVEERFPDDILALLEGYVHGPRDAYEIWYEQEGRELEDGYINSDRGSALETLMRVLDKRGDIKRKWELIEYVAQDPSSVLRVGAVQELLYMLRNDRERAITLFENLLEGHSLLLKSHHVHQFLYYGIKTHFSRMKLFVHALLESDDGSCQQRGTELACMAAISPYIRLTEEEHAEAKTMASEATTGSSACRCGAARVYAANIANVTAATHELSKLLNDEDVQVQNMINRFLNHLQAEHISSLREFLEAYAASRAISGGLHIFAEYLWKHGSLDPRWSLSIVTIILNNPYYSERTSRAIGIEKLIRLVLNIYQDPTVPSLHEEAMDVFDRLMDHYPSDAQKVLKQWDDK